MDPHVPIFDPAGDGVVLHGDDQGRRRARLVLAQPRPRRALRPGQLRLPGVVRRPRALPDRPARWGSCSATTCSSSTRSSCCASRSSRWSPTPSCATSAPTRPPALVAGVLFAFLPYHLLRNQSHLFLTSYYAIPLGRLARRDDRRGPHAARPRGQAPDAARRRRLPRRRRRVELLRRLRAAACSVCVVPVAAIARRSRRVLVQGAAVIALVGASFTLCHAPAIVYPLLHGPNDAVAERLPGESELFGLKLAYMVIPRPEHRVERPGAAAASATSPRRRCAPRASRPSIGLGGDARPGRRDRRPAVDRARRRAARRCADGGSPPPARSRSIAFAVGTIGGVSTLIALELSPQVRAWNRLSLVIAFAALLALALALTALGDRLRARGRPRLDRGRGHGRRRRPRHPRPDLAARRPGLRADRRRVAGRRGLRRPMQDRFPAGTKVLQLPYMSYPENGSVLGVGDYDLFKGYLHSAGPEAGATARSADARRTGSPSTRSSRPTSSPRPRRRRIRRRLRRPRRLRRRRRRGRRGARRARRTRRRRRCSADKRLQFFDLRPAARAWPARSRRPSARQIRDALLYPVRDAASATASPTRSCPGRPRLPLGHGRRPPDARQPAAGTRTRALRRRAHRRRRGAVDGDVHAARRQPPHRDRRRPRAAA